MRASWTYEVAPAGADVAGLEEYMVETRDGEAAGKVVAFVDRAGERFLVFDTGTPPVAKERRAVRWEDVAEVDHDTLTVTLRLGADRLIRRWSSIPRTKSKAGTPTPSASPSFRASSHRRLSLSAGRRTGRPTRPGSSCSRSGLWRSSS
jgi:hypothetical protein